MNGNLRKNAEECDIGDFFVPPLGIAPRQLKITEPQLEGAELETETKRFEPEVRTLNGVPTDVIIRFS